MKTIFIEREVTLNNGYGFFYTFEGNEFVQRCEIQRMMQDMPFWYEKGGRSLIIEPITDKELIWFIGVAKLNDFIQYRVIDIKK